MPFEPTGVHMSVIQLIASGFASFVAGSRTIPLGDNGKLISELAARFQPRRPDPLKLEGLRPPPRADRSIDP
jgi:hypothetical protein